MPSVSPRRTKDGRRRLRRATPQPSTTISSPCGRRSTSMSNNSAVASDAMSQQYRDWLRRERRGRVTVRLVQIAILVVCLVLWEVLPRAQIINPLFTSYPSAIWPTFVGMLKASPQQASILAHTLSTVVATVIGFSAAMILGTVIAAALWWWNALYKVLDPYLVVANAMPKTAFVPIFYIW